MALKGARYRKYLETEEWKERRDEAVERAEGRCQLCNAGPPLHAHHRTYERAGNEKPMDLTVLCAGCHYRFHHKPKLETTATKASKRERIDQEDLAILRSSGAISYTQLRKQMHQVPRAQLWSRVQKLIKRGTLEWCSGQTKLRIPD